MADIQEQLKQAINFIKLGEKGTAVQLLTSVIQQDKTNTNAWFLLANALTDRDKQIKALENALKIDPNYTRAQTMLDKLRPPEPQKQAVSAAPFVVDENFEEDDYEEPEAAFAEYDADDDPFDDFDEPEEAFDDVDPRLIEAVALIRDGDDRGAEALAREVIREDRENVEAWWIMANAIDDETKRVKALEKVLALKPDHDEARDWLDEIQNDDSFADLDDEDDADEGMSFLDSIADEEIEDPFAEFEDEKEQSVASSGGGGMLVFNIISFILMVGLGVGGAFGIQMLTTPETIFAAQDDGSGGMSMGGDFGMGDVTFDTGFNSFSSDCRQDLDTANLTIRDDLDFDDAVIRGPITRGNTVGGYRYELYDEAYVYTATANEVLTILLSTTTSDYDPMITVYTPDAQQLVFVDRGWNGEDERLPVTFPEAGDYFILVQAFGFGCGDYLLTVE
jgi:tetratricopeptide (TPR) repeat protein